MMAYPSYCKDCGGELPYGGTKCAECQEMDRLGAELLRDAQVQDEPKKGECNAG